MRKVIAVLLTAAVMVGCTNTGPNQTGGQIIGGVAGGLLGSQFGGGDGRLVATAVGAIAGTFIGGQVGKSMDDRDRALASQSANTALENNRDNVSSSWNNPNTSRKGSFTPVNSYQRNDGVWCRDYVNTVYIDGKAQQMKGRACRIHGEWVPAN